MKETNYWSTLIDGIGWDKMTTKQKLISVWFYLSFILVCISGESLLFAAISIANFGISSYKARKLVPMEDY